MQLHLNEYCLERSSKSNILIIILSNYAANNWQMQALFNSTILDNLINRIGGGNSDYTDEIN